MRVVLILLALLVLGIPLFPPSLLADSGPFQEAQVLVAGDPDPSDRFGRDVAVSGDAAVIGAFTDDGGAINQPGAAYIFRLVLEQARFNPRYELK